MKAKSTRGDLEPRENGPQLLHGHDYFRKTNQNDTKSFEFWGSEMERGLEENDLRMSLGLFENIRQKCNQEGRSER